ncbi:MAG: hypothetical protein PVI92_15275 [Chromatiales bacterium]|jgi:hypothetical protein
MSKLKYSAQGSIKRRVIGLFLSMLVIASGIASAGPREQAKRIHDRLAGVPPSDTTLQQMEDLIDSDQPLDAAMLAIEHPDFYNVTLKNWVTPWTNEEKTVFAPLNDYTATVIGMVRDEIDFREVLSGNILYVGPSSLPAYSNSNNNHYEEMENQGLDLKDVLVRTTQSSVTGLPSQATAGVVTTRAAARAFFIDGTNRAMLSFTVLNHLCRDLEMIKDPTRPTDRIRQDVARSPGGDSRVYFNNCLGCHAGMEPLAEAYAYYDFQYPEVPDGADEEAYFDMGQLVYTANVVQAKYLINSNNFKDGYATFDDSWINYWREGPNSVLGWNSSLPDHGNGAKSMGVELANSHAFAECQVTKAFEAVCLRTPEDSLDLSQIDTMTSNFKSGYNMKQVFAQAAVYCMGD